MAGHQYRGGWRTVDTHGSDGYLPDGRIDPALVDETTVPSGAVDVVLEWVGVDVDRAQLALAAERQRSRPRTGVVDVVEQLLTDDT